MEKDEGNGLNVVGVHDIANLSHANLRHAKLSRAQLQQDLLEVRRRGLKYINLNDVDLSDADLSYLDLSNINFYGANFSRANLCRANLSHANLSHANLSGANLSHANLYHAKLSRAQLQQVLLEVRRRGLKYINLNDVDLSYADLSYLDLSHINFDGANFSCANLSHADLRQANICRVDLKGANISDIYIGGAFLRTNTFSQLIGKGHKDFSDVDLRFVFFSEINYPSYNLSALNFTNALLPDRFIEWAAQSASDPEDYDPAQANCFIKNNDLALTTFHAGLMRVPSYEQLTSEHFMNRFSKACFVIKEGSRLHTCRYLEQLIPYLSYFIPVDSLSSIILHWLTPKRLLNCIEPSVNRANKSERKKAQELKKTKENLLQSECAIKQLVGLLCDVQKEQHQFEGYLSIMRMRLVIVMDEYKKAHDLLGQVIQVFREVVREEQRLAPQTQGVWLQHEVPGVLQNSSGSALMNVRGHPIVSGYSLIKKNLCSSDEGQVPIAARRGRESKRPVDDRLEVAPPYIGPRLDMLQRRFFYTNAEALLEAKRQLAQAMSEESQAKCLLEQAKVRLGQTQYDLTQAQIQLSRCRYDLQETHRAVNQMLEALKGRVNQKFKNHERVYEPISRKIHAFYWEYKASFLLKLVAAGNREGIKAYIPGREYTLCYPSNVTDGAGRQFFGVTALQYAFWALDVGMCKMLLGYLKGMGDWGLDEARRQLSSWVNKQQWSHGSHFYFQAFLEAYEWYINVPNGEFIYELGNMQRSLPDHFLIEIFNVTSPSNSFAPRAQSFREGVSEGGLLGQTWVACFFEPDPNPKKLWSVVSRRQLQCGLKRSGIMRDREMFIVLFISAGYEQREFFESLFPLCNCSPVRPDPESKSPCGGRRL